MDSDHNAYRFKQPTNCAHFVLNATLLQLIPAYSSQRSHLSQTLAGIGPSEPE